MDRINESVKLTFRSKKNMLRMLEFRGYIIEDERGILTMTLNEFVQIFNHGRLDEPLNDMYQNISNIYYTDEGYATFVSFLPNPNSKKSATIGIQILQNLHDEITSKYPNVYDIIIVSEANISPPAKKQIFGLKVSESEEKEIEKEVIKKVENKFKGYIYQKFSYDELVIDKKEHCFVPPHNLLDKEQAESLVSRFPISQLPTISNEDPMVKYMGLMPKDVVQILRKSPLPNSTVPYSLYWRVVKQLDLESKSSS